MKELYDEIVKYYSDNIDYGASRLWEEFNVPPEYLHIFQTAHNMGNNIYMVGMNQYDIRILLGVCLSLNDVKELFM